MSCDLDEDPIFLDSQAVYTDINVAKGALDGIYQGLTSYGAQEQRLLLLQVIRDYLLQVKTAVTTLIM